MKVTLGTLATLIMILQETKANKDMKLIEFELFLYFNLPSLINSKSANACGMWL